MDFFKKILNNITKPWFNQLIAILTLVVFIGGLVIKNDKIWIIIFLIVVIIWLFSILTTLIIAINKYLSLTEQTDYIENTIILSYKSKDGYTHEYETYKSIQCKEAYKVDFEHKFIWSGGSYPEINNISSISQRELKIKPKKCVPGKVEYSILATFQVPILYNQPTLLHIKQSLYDPEQIVLPILTHKIKKSTQILHFKVILDYKTQNSPALISRLRINNISNIWDSVSHVPFDIPSKSFEYFLPNPELGYVYKIQWTK